jgi:predicted nuclease with TOPRIM domain
MSFFNPYFTGTITLNPYTTTIPNTIDTANFILTGNQTINGVKTFSSSPYNEAPPATDVTEAKINSLADENKQLKQRVKLVEDRAKRIEDEFQAIKDQLAKRSTSLAELEDVCNKIQSPAEVPPKI